VKSAWLTIFFLAAVFFGQTSALQGQTDHSAVALGDSVGAEIDSVEREAYYLFPDVKGFKSAQLFRLSDSKYRLNYTYEEGGGLRHKSRTVSADAVELTQLHLKLAEEYWQLKRSGATGQKGEAELLYELGLKYASQAKYDRTSFLFGDLLSKYPESQPALRAAESKEQVERLWKTKKALFWQGSLLNQSGRTDVLIFSGYYGVWLGIATPIVFGAESPEPFGAGLLLGPSLSLLIAHTLTKEANISEGRATMIALGGHLGTWQGLGWAAMTDADGKTVVAIGEVAGLAGIAAATVLTSKVDFSIGHSGLTSWGMYWGGWFGLVTAALADHEENDLLRDMLIGSDVLVVGTGIAARNVQMSRARVRLINLGGVLGTVFGFGIDLLGNIEGAPAVLGIAGAGSLAGLAAGAYLTRDYDKGKELSFFERDNSQPGYVFEGKEKAWSIYPRLSLRKNKNSDNGLLPSLVFGLRF